MGMNVFFQGSKNGTGCAVMWRLAVQVSQLVSRRSCERFSTHISPDDGWWIQNECFVLIV
jgi:hypothetical protein